MSSSTKRRIHEIDVQMLRSWMNNGEAYVIDVRELGEYQAEHIPGANFMALSDFNPEQLHSLTHEIIVLQCQSGTRSAQAAQKMFEAGIKNVTHLRGGLTTWKAAGYPTVVDRKAPVNMLRQVQISAGSLVLLGCALAIFASPWFLLVSAFVGSGLIIAGVTNTCGMAILLSKLPYNQRAVHKGEMRL